MDVIHTTLKPSVPHPEWFRHWFDTAHYHKLYSHRDHREAAGLIDELIERLQPAPNSTIVDLGCGAGRHARQLAARGFRVTGLDLAAGSIARARRYETDSLRFLQHDMRHPFGRSFADYVLNLFTSFGYFTEEEHHAVIHNISEALKPEGTLVLDYLNVDYTEARIVPSEEREIDGITYAITRWMDGKHFFKRITIADNALSGPLEHTEQVAKFRLEDFNDMFARHNLRTEEVYGDYRLNDYDKAKSPRMIIVARKDAD